MKLGHLLVKKLPASRLRKISWTRWLIKREFDRLIEDAIKKQHPDDPQGGLVQMLQSDEYEELRLLSEEEESIKSVKILALAKKLDVPSPSLYDEQGALSQDWQEGSVGYRFALSDSGRNRLREEIRKEIKARHEQRARWLAWLTPAIAAAGIVATILTRK